MRAILRPHPDWPCEAVSGIDVEVERPSPGRLALRYLIAAARANLLIPPPAERARTDHLWRHTCFEAFLRPSGTEAYAELNFAPSGQWAAYSFDRYRDAMRPAEVRPPAIAWTATPGGFELTAEVELIGIAQGPWRLGLSAVIEGVDGRTAYWALAHPPGKADFHRDEGFALTLPGPISA